MKKNVILSIVGVLLVLGIGVSFAYFVSQTLVSGDGASVTAEPGDMIKVTYDAGSTPLSGNNLMPGDSTSKDFSVTVTPTETEKEATYGIFLDITENTFVKCDDTNYNDLTNMCTKDAQELTYTIKDKDSGSTLASGDLTGVTGKVKLLTETKTVDTETIFNYTITITFNDTGADQNHNQNKTFNGDVEVEFSELTAKDVILANYPNVLTRDNFSSTVTSETTGTIYKSLDDTQYDNDGEVYYFAGNPSDNWVSWAGFYWRIIRINGDGSLRLIYNGTSTATTGTGTQLQTSAYNSSYNDNAYVGYMYGSRGASSYSATHTNTTNSTIKGILDNWYKTNIEDKNYSKDVSTEQGFCNDRRIASSSETFWNSDTKRGYGTNTTAYALFSRFLNTGGSWDSTQTPTLKCSQTNDYFTVSGSSKGNHKLTYPVGLITADEVVLAGGFGGSNNTSYYLYTNQNYWTMSPCYYGSSYGARVFSVYSSGSFGDLNVDGALGVRPVINLKSDVQISGSGTTSNPYVISLSTG